MKTPVASSANKRPADVSDEFFARGALLVVGRTRRLVVVART